MMRMSASAMRRVMRSQMSCSLGWRSLNGSIMNRACFATSPLLCPIEEKYVDAIRELGGTLPPGFSQTVESHVTKRKPPVPAEKIAEAADMSVEEISQEITSPEGLVFLGDVMWSGLKTEKLKISIDQAKAAQLWRRAGERGSDEGIYQYANCLVHGTGVAQNHQQAEALLTSLVERGHALAQYTLAVLLLSRGRAAEKAVKDDSITERVYYLLKGAIKGGILPAINNLANLLAEGSTKIPRDDDTAFQLYSLGASLGDPWCTYTLASWLCQGRGGDEDWEKGFELHLKAATTYGMPQAQYNTATHYFSGRGVKQDMPKAAVYFEKAAQAGMPQAMVNLGNMYLEELVPCDDALGKARHWYEKATAMGNETAKQCLMKLDNEMTDEKAPPAESQAPVEQQKEKS